MEIKDLDKVPVVWKPTETSGKNIRDFQQHISQKYNVKLESYWDFHRWSVENVSKLYEEIWEKYGVIYSKPYTKVLDGASSVRYAPNWFPGVRLNHAQNILKYRDDRVALYATGEERDSKEISYAELYHESCRYGACLRKLGLKKNECVVCYMPNREEAVFAMLGATAIGAVWGGALPQLGSKAVLNRFRQLEPRFLFTIDRFLNDGEEKNLLENLKEISKELPSLVKVVIVASKPESRQKDITEIRNSCFLDEFLSVGENSDGSVPDLEFEQLPFDHPVYVSFTSGTTGNPKALIHGVGTILTTARDIGLHYNTTRDDVFLSMSPVGWATWNMYANMLHLGLSIILYEGVPFFKHPTSIWDLTDKYNISCLMIMPSVLEELERRGYTPGEHNSLASLKLIMSGGTVVTTQNYDFVYKKVKSDIIFASIYGTTEQVGISMLFDETLPVHLGEISTPSLGLSVLCIDDTGKAVSGKLGELVYETLSPSMPLGIWHDPDGTRYKENYLKYHDKFATGDLGYINPATKGIVICCRWDDTLKQRGCRFGSSEIYTVLKPFTEVLDSLCVSQYNEKKQERAVLFLQMRTNHRFSEELTSRIRIAIEKELSKRHVPEVILETPEIPYNMNGKKTEIIVKKIINHMPYQADTVENFECLKFYEDIPQLKDFC